MKKIKLFFGKFIKNIVNEVFTARTKEILDAGVSKQAELASAVSELDVYGGLMDRKEFVSKLKHTVKLVELRKEWIEASIYSRKGLPTIEMLIDIEKEIKRKFDIAKRGGVDKKNDAFFAEGGLTAFKLIKEALE